MSGDDDRKAREALVSKCTILISVIALASLTSLGAAAQGDACAAHLTPDGKTIYEAARAANPTLPNLRETMVTVVKGLVGAGKIAPAGAQDNGGAAGQCMAANLRANSPSQASPSGGESRTGRLCDQKVDYTLYPPLPALTAQQKSFAGLWRGGVAYGATVEVCAGFVFERVGREGVSGQYIWSTAAGNGISGVGSVGVAKWVARWDGDALRAASRDGQWGWELRLISPNEISGFYTSKGNRRPVWLKRN